MELPKYINTSIIALIHLFFKVFFIFLFYRHNLYRLTSGESYHFHRRETEIVCINGLYSALEYSGVIKGKLRGNERGFAFLVSEKGDLFITDEERANFMANSGMGGKYDATVDRESAYEILTQVAVEAQAAQEEKEKPIPS